MKHILKIILSIGAFISLIALSVPAFASSLPVGASQFYLAGAGITSSATSITLTSLTTPDGRLITMSNFGTVGYGAVDPQTTAKIEDISFTGITQNANGTATLTGVTRGMDFIYPYASTASLKKAHSGGATFIVTNTAGFYYTEFTMNNNNNLFTWPTASTSPAGKGYVDFVAFNGATVLNASESLKGVVQLATNLQAASSTSTGSAGARLVLPSSIATSTYNSATAPLSVVVTQNNGKIDPYFIATSSLGLSFSPDIQTFTATTSSSTWTKMSGAKTVYIVLFGGGASGQSGANFGNGGTGGNGGGGGGVLIKTLPASILGSTESIGIGVGGAGIASPGNTANGNDGGITNFGTWAKAYGGSGSSAAGGAGSGIGCTTPGGGASTGGACGGAAGSVNQPGGNAGAGYVFGAGGGGAGGSGNQVGGNGGSQLGKGTPAGGAGGAGAGNTTGNPGAAPSNVPANEPTAGAGGGGGGGVSGSSGVGGTGGHGGLYGGGGGGGGGDGSGGGTGGTSGSGADGFAMVITYF